MLVSILIFDRFLDDFGGYFSFLNLPKIDQKTNPKIDHMSENKSGKLWNKKLQMLWGRAVLDKMGPTKFHMLLLPHFLQNCSSEGLVVSMPAKWKPQIFMFHVRLNACKWEMRSSVFRSVTAVLALAIPWRLHRRRRYVVERLSKNDEPKERMNWSNESAPEEPVVQSWHLTTEWASEQWTSRRRAESGDETRRQREIPNEGHGWVRPDRTAGAQMTVTDRAEAT